MKNIHVGFLFFFITFSFSQIDITINNDSNSITNFLDALNQASNFPNSATPNVIRFNSGIYDLTNISGGINFLIPDNTVVRGASVPFNISSTIKGVQGNLNTTLLLKTTGAGQLIINGNNVRIRDLQLEGRSLTINDNFLNINLQNLIFGNTINSHAVLNADRGFSGNIIYCTFNQFSNKAIVFNRKLYPFSNLVSGILTIRNCNFIPENPSLASAKTRAISIDAGNDEISTIWDLNGMEIYANLFNDCGVAFSKCSNFFVGKNNQVANEFNLSVLYDTPIHFEEFSEHAYVENNNFNIVSSSFSEGIVDLGSRAGSNYININNNRLSYLSSSNISIKSFVSGTANTDISITNNIVDSNINFDNNRGINFVKLHPESCGVSKNLIINNNTNITGNNIYVLIKSNQNQQQAMIENNLLIPNNYNAIFQNNSQCELPYGESEGYYSIRNKSNNLFLSANSVDGWVELSNTQSNNTKWKLSFVYPAYYTLESVGFSNNFLGVIRGYFEVDQALPDFGEPLYEDSRGRLFNVNVNERKPIWFIKEVTGFNDEFHIYPGGNEFFTRLEREGNTNRVFLTENKERVNGVFQTKPTQINSRWEIISSPLNESLFELNYEPKIYPNPISNNQSYITIEYPDISQIKIIDSKGTILINKELELSVQKIQFDCVLFSDGIYNIVIISRNGKIINSKFVKM
ncbi:MAG: hypothetical protein CMP76_15635 [Flavobacterium sp.]|uniref:T9SS type A sorting domain-containing protein n=1 Tax=Flavobacterium sp. TaxID=239 RepID=UPI000C37FD16|nr:T9SS type A sorting domain-containing protein [Flavobacterium sp.]MBF04714.1 hypothetical protein [Flavobacterium sp.]|tara:strand:+ start:2116 stop:4185 length:2070 start_codon:yes stop_codon:yes gene_type:complete